MLSRQEPILDKFIFHEQHSDATYNYYVFMDRAGQVLVMRITLSNTEARYFLGRVEDYTDIISNIATLTYKKINEIK